MNLSGILRVTGFLFLIGLNACTSSPRTIVVRFEDLKSDFFAMEYRLEQGEWNGDAGDARTATERGLQGARDVRS